VKAAEPKREHLQRLVRSAAALGKYGEFVRACLDKWSLLRRVVDAVEWVKSLMHHVLRAGVMVESSRMWNTQLKFLQVSILGKRCA
jgi:hypothetical protein